MVVFIASLLGSPHCSAMCGGFVALSTQNARPLKSQMFYHGGRLITYIALGALAGVIGGVTNSIGFQAGIAQAATILTGSMLLIFGISMLLGHTQMLHSLFPSSVYTKIRKQFTPDQSKPLLFAFALGLFSTLLPCGWLYTYVAVAAGTGAVLPAMIIMSAFWIGTLPMLITVGSLSSLIASPLKKYVPIVTSCLMIAAGILSLSAHLGIGPLSHAHSPGSTTSHQHNH